MKTLYELSQEISDLFEELEAFAEANEGAVPPDLDSKLEAVSLERREKIGAICAVYKEFAGRSEILAGEAKKLQARAKSLLNHAEALKAYLARNVPEGEKLDVGPHRVSWRKSSSVELMPGITAEDVPELYQRHKVEFAKDEAKKAMAAGEELWFAQMVEKKNLQIG